MEAIETEKKLTTQEQPGLVPGCPGDCKKCRALQQMYCAAQMSYYSVHAISDIQKAMQQMGEMVVRTMDSVAILSDRVSELQAKVSSLAEAPVLVDAPCLDGDSSPRKRKPKTSKEELS